MSQTPGKGSNTMLFVIIGVVVCCVICLSVVSGVGATLYYNYHKEIEVGKIGGKCFDNLTCTSPYICIKGECYEDCEPDLASTDCRSNFNFQRHDAYYCDYGECNDWWREPTQEDYDEYSDIFKEALRLDIENKKRQAEEKAQREIEAEQKKTQQEIEEAQQKSLCQCSAFAGTRLHPETKQPIVCDKGLYEGDGGDVKKWCYVSGGHDCRGATRSINPKTRGLAWKLCGN